MVKTYKLIAQIRSGTIQTSSTGKQFNPCACKQNIDINIMTMNFNECLLHRATQPNCAGPFWEILDLANEDCCSRTRGPKRISESTWHIEEN